MEQLNADLAGALQLLCHHHADVLSTAVCGKEAHKQSVM